MVASGFVFLDCILLAALGSPSIVASVLLAELCINKIIASCSDLVHVCDIHISQTFLGLPARGQKSKARLAVTANPPYRALARQAKVWFSEPGAVSQIPCLGTLRKHSCPISSNRVCDFAALASHAK